MTRRRDRREQELARELQDYFDRRVADLVNEGRSESDARRQAHIEFGGVTQVQEAVRDAWGWRWLDTFTRDARFAMRSLRKRWGLTLGAGAILALTIGVTTAIFSVVNVVLIQPLAYPDADRLVSIETFWTATGRSTPEVSGPDFHDWQTQSDVVDAMAAFYSNPDEAIFLGNRAVFGNTSYVSADFFTVFGQAPAAGRLLAAGDVPPGDRDSATAVVAHQWAVAQYGSADAAIGKAIKVYGATMSIVGVAEPGFRFPGSTDLWAAMRPTSAAANRGDHPYQAVARLTSGIDLARAQVRMRAIGDALAARYPENRHKSVALVSLQERLTGHHQSTLWMLMGMVGIVWLIGCANIANLLLARAADRTREIALRTALGAGRGRVVRQLLTESGVLAGGAGLAGLLLALTLVRAFIAWSPADLPRLTEVRVDETVLLFALGLSAASTVLFGLASALQSSRLDLSAALKSGGAKATSTRGHSRFRSALVVAEVALSVVLLVTAGLLLRSFQSLQQVDLGFTKDRVLVADTIFAVRDGVDEDSIKRSQFYADVLDRFRAVPGVTAASGVAYLGMGREPRAPRDFFIEGRPEGRAGERPRAEHHAITPDYFRTLEIPIRAGRDFNLTDTRDRPQVAIVNEAMARLAFPGASPLGHRLRVNNRSRWMEIVGVAADTRWQDPSHAAPPAVYSPSTQGWGNSLALLARTSGDERALTGSLRAIMHDLDASVPVRFETMDQLFDSTLAHPRFRAQLTGLFAGIAALLASVGIFSVLAYIVGQRARELAVRRALGASAAEVIRLVLTQSMWPVVIGLVLGLAGAFAMARLLTGLLYQVSPWDAGAYLWTIVGLGIAAIAATLVPAIRAASIAPVVVLQQD